MRKKVLCTRIEDMQIGTRLFVLCWFIYFSSYIGRYNYSAAMSTMISDGVLNLDSAGAVATAYFFLYGAGQLINGIIGSRTSPYKMAFIGLLGAGISNIVMSFSSSYILFVIIWAANGYFQSMIWPPICRLFAESLPIEQQNKACVNIVSTTPAGTLASYAVAAIVLGLGVWRNAFVSSGILMIAASFVWRFTTSKIEKDYTNCIANEKTEKTKSDVNTNKKLVGLIVASGVAFLIIPTAMHGALKDGVTSWVPIFVETSFNTSASFSILLTMALPVINLSGAYIADFLNRKVFKNDVLTGTMLFVVATIALIFLPLAVKSSLVITIILLSITTSAMLGVNTIFMGIIPVKLGKNGNAGIISGALNATAYIGAAISSWGFGASIQGLGWSGTIILWVLCAGIGALLCAFAINKYKNYFIKH